MDTKLCLKTPFHVIPQHKSHLSYSHFTTQLNCHYTVPKEHLIAGYPKKDWKSSVNNGLCISTTLSIFVNLTALLPEDQKVEIILFCVKSSQSFMQSTLAVNSSCWRDKWVKSDFSEFLIAHNLELRCCISMSCSTWVLLNFKPSFEMWTLIGGWAGRGLRFILAVPKGIFTWYSQHCWAGIDWEISLGKFGSICSIGIETAECGGRVFCAETRNSRNRNAMLPLIKRGEIPWTEEGKCGSLCALSQFKGPWSSSEVQEKCFFSLGNVSFLPSCWCTAWSQYWILTPLLQEFCAFLCPASEADFCIGFLRIFITTDH